MAPSKLEGAHELGEGAPHTSNRNQISRPTGYKWIDRITTEGLRGVVRRLLELVMAPEPR
jgi:hypothetical protein